MNIINFTPLSALVGGIIIGLAVILFFVGNGRLAGVSGIVNDTLVSKQNRTDNFLFIVGLVLGPIFYAFFTKNDIIDFFYCDLIMGFIFIFGRTLVNPSATTLSP